MNSAELDDLYSPSNLGVVGVRPLMTYSPSNRWYPAAHYGYGITAMVTGETSRPKCLFLLISDIHEISATRSEPKPPAFRHL